MKKINFYKMSGSGNDFIIIDNRDNVVEENNLSDFISSVCQRKMSVGADGLILIESAENVALKTSILSGGFTIPMEAGLRCAEMAHGVRHDLHI